MLRRSRRVLIVLESTRSNGVAGTALERAKHSLPLVVVAALVVDSTCSFSWGTQERISVLVCTRNKITTSTAAATTEQQQLRRFGCVQICLSIVGSLGTL